MKYFTVAILWSVFIAVVSFLPATRLPEVKLHVFEPDKLAHAAVYGLFTVFLLWAFWRMDRLNIKTVLLSMGVSIFYGILMECAQFFFFPGRHFEIYDIIANIIGTLFGSIVAFFLIK